MMILFNYDVSIVPFESFIYTNYLERYSVIRIGSRFLSTDPTEEEVCMEDLHHCHVFSLQIEDIHRRNSV